MSELIWNDYDADATKVSVTFEDNNLTSIKTIRISDNGTGIDPEQAEAMFGGLGASGKKRKRKTDGGRFVHGEKGQGRFKAFSLGKEVTWLSDFKNHHFSIHGNISDPKHFPVSEISPATRKGCIVEITDIQKDFEIRASHGATDKITDIFALQLFEDPSFEIEYDGHKIDAHEAIREVEENEIQITSENGAVIEARLEIVEWNKRIDRKLMLCLPGLFSFHEMPAGIQARGLWFTAYLTSEYFQTLVNDNTEGLVELDVVANQLLEETKVKLREHFREKESVRSRSKIEEWKKAEIYPYEGDTESPIERNERQVFDVVALNLADYSSDFEKTPPKSQKLILQLVKAAVEAGPSALPDLLNHVIDLPKDKQEDLANLLKRTTLTAVINAARSVSDRLDFLKALQILIFNAASKRQLLERSQLHRVIAEHTWLFGEQFNLTNDDEDLSSVLRSHLKLLGPDREELAPDEPVRDADGKTRIVDLMLSQRLPTSTDDERKHLVIELKRPSRSINEDVVNQIKKYAKAVALDDRFKKSSVEWDFLAVSNRFEPNAELEAKQTGKPRGLVLELDEPKIRVWAKTWGQIIDESQGRLTFFKRGLEYEANDEHALSYLSNISDEYLSDEVRQKISELAAE
ncbi:MAG: ATP-binding protein [Paracoccaceae bacterium]|nr:ATP-binding protein [Paracoccaceae bacterium]